jgi:hypothetical protein
MNVSEIRARYPRPVTTRNSVDSYCVGGAFCLSVGYRARFPRKEFLTMILPEANPHLSGLQALRFARLIVQANDAGDFEAAWKHLNAALVWPNASGRHGGKPKEEA